MSDYMFMLESHLNPEQNRVVAEVAATADKAGVALFLTGGAMRDMLGGFAIRDLDFTVEANALKLVKAIEQKGGARVVSVDEDRNSAEMVFPGGVTAQIGMAHRARYPKPGGRPQVEPSTIYEDLRGRDFTINSIALSLTRASRGLLIDPTNGAADLERRELQTTGNTTLYDDPVRLIRLVRFKVRLGFSVEARTQQQYENARAAQMEQTISSRVLLRELFLAADEPNPAELLHAFDQESLLTLFCPALTGAKLNLAGLAKLQKARQMIPFGVDLKLNSFGLVLFFLTEKLTARDKAAFVRNLGIRRPDVELWQGLEARSKKLEKELKSPKLRKPSQIYQALREAPGDQVLFLLLRSSQRIVHDRIRNYLQKYLPASMEITEQEIAAAGGQPGTPKYRKVKEELVVARVDGRTRKPVPEPVPSAPTTTAARR